MAPLYRDFRQLKAELQRPPHEVTQAAVLEVADHFIAVARTPNLPLTEVKVTIDLRRTIQDIHPRTRRRIEKIACRRTIAAAVRNAVDTLVATVQRPGPEQHLWTGFQFTREDDQTAVNEILGNPEDVTEFSLKTVAGLLRNARRCPKMPVQTAVEIVYIVRVIREGIFPVANCVHPFTLIGLKRFTWKQEVEAAYENAIDTLMLFACGSANPGCDAGLDHRARNA